MMFSKRWIGLAAMLCIVAVISSAGGSSHADLDVANALISDAQEEQLGARIHQQMLDEGLRVNKDPTVNTYVDGLVGQLEPAAAKDRPGVQWRVFVIDDPKTVNAFSTPGGFVYVYTGLLLTADTEAEVIGVLGHEMGHVVARHSVRQLVTRYGLEALAAIAIGHNPALLHAIATVIAAKGALLAHSRKDENEADTYAVRYASAAGYDPNGIATFFQKLEKGEGRQSRAAVWLQTHPATPDRITHVDAVIAGEHLTGSKIGADSLAPIKARLSRGPLSER
jgi:predicted Zn-dependent protease